jgi:hypothetical protein
VVQCFVFSLNNPKCIGHQMWWIVKYKSSRVYTNLHAEIISAHLEYASLTDNTKRNQRLLEDCFYPAKVKSYWTWLDWVIGEFSFVEKEQTRNQCKVSRISIDAFMKTMNLVTAYVEEKFAALLPDTFALVLLVKLTTWEYFLRIQKITQNKGTIKIFLSFALLTNEESLNADAHIAFFDYLLELYEKDWSNVAVVQQTNHLLEKRSVTSLDVKVINLIWL